jgi:hypothetical protein
MNLRLAGTAGLVRFGSVAAAVGAVLIYLAWYRVLAMHDDFGMNISHPVQWLVDWQRAVFGGLFVGSAVATFVAFRSPATRQVQVTASVLAGSIIAAEVWILMQCVCLPIARLISDLT